jgi:hypothetical protein
MLSLFLWKIHLRNCARNKLYVKKVKYSQKYASLATANLALDLDIINYLFKEEVSRAKKQLQSMLMMNLESRIVMFEDIGRLDMSCYS